MVEWNIPGGVYSLVDDRGRVKELAISIKFCLGASSCCHVATEAKVIIEALDVSLSIA
jgi:hypothetical protein